MTGIQQTVGEYARFVGISKSPHLRSIFKQLEKEEIIVGKNENYKATVMRVYEINYEVVSKLYPHIREILMEIGWQETLL